ncbi:rRNA biogenesis protein rrp36 [Exophiala xenobiotica]|nr:rRNA biogenesis protein rrp36 [Exophiala xenobiotica]
MKPARLLDQPIQLRPDDAGDVEEVEDEFSDQGDDDEAQSQDSDSAQSDLGFEDEEDDLESEPEDGLPLKDISFGALAKAQETFDPRPRKRKLAEALEGPLLHPEKNEEDTFDTRKRAKEARIDGPKRSSKHAPVVESARKPVSRKRTIFEPAPAQKFRDPRFDPTVMSANRDSNATEKASKNYSFLTQYQASEILDLKSQIKKAKDSETVADLKRKVMSLESKLRNAEMRQKQEEVKKRHKQQEKEALRTGQKAAPYYLKDAEVKKLVKEEKLQSMSKSAREKSEKKRMKREKGKEGRDMPRVRRER